MVQDLIASKYCNYDLNLILLYLEAQVFHYTKLPPIHFKELFQYRAFYFSQGRTTPPLVLLFFLPPKCCFSNIAGTLFNSVFGAYCIHNNIHMKEALHISYLI